MRKVSFKEVEDIAEADKDLRRSWHSPNLSDERQGVAFHPWGRGGLTRHGCVHAGLRCAIRRGAWTALRTGKLHSKSKSFLLSKAHVSSNFPKFANVLFVIFLPASTNIFYFESICKVNRIRTSLPVAYKYMVNFSFLCVLCLIFWNHCLKFYPPLLPGPSFFHFLQAWILQQ